MKIENNNLKNIKKLIGNGKKITPHFGNNRSFSCVSTKRKWNCNKQSVKINGKKYKLSPKLFKQISKKIENKI